MKYYNIAIYYMSNIKNIVFFIGGGAIGLGTLYFVYNNFQNVSNNSTKERTLSLDSNEDIGEPPWKETPPVSREPSLDNGSRSLSNESNSSTSTYGDFFKGGSKNKKTKKLKFINSRNNNKKKLSRKNKNSKTKRK